MATFVLVHGAWHGGWCWAATEAALAKRGHRSFALTLAGLGEKSHLLHRDITPDNHVDDVVNFLKWRDLTEVVLVGHSYGGLVITGVASKVPEAITSMIYLDALVPKASGDSIFANSDPVRFAGFQKQIETGAAGLEPDLFDAWTDDEATKAWLKSKCTPQPVGTFLEGVTLTGREAEVARKLYILATGNKPSMFWEVADRVRGQPGWVSAEIAAKHDAMVDAPEKLAEIFDTFEQGER